MYLVSFEIFNEFITKKELTKNDIPICKTLPCIIEYKKGDIVMAKVEVINISEFKFLMKYAGKLGINKGSKDRKNKYWIRGNEWETVNNQVVQKLEY